MRTGYTSPTARERWIDRALAARPTLTLVPGHCPWGHASTEAEYSRGFDYEYHSVRDEFRGRVCRDCGTWYLDPRPAEQDFAVIYPDSYSAYAMTGATGTGDGVAFRAKAWIERRKIRRYAKFVAAIQGEVLDVGCGDGLLLDSFARAGFPRHDLVGIDFHPLAVELARARGHRIVEGRFEAADLGAARYRLIVMNQLIEHLPDPLAALHKLHGLLVPGGHVFLETPNLDSPNARLARHRHWGGYHYPRHLYLFSPHSIADALSHAELQLVEIRYVPCPVQWVLTINNLLQEWRRPWASLLRFTDWRNPILLGLFTVADLL
ncbi:MAG: class I SAM-dependent methyltransferase, partial [Candidatus Binatia bacterium]